MTAGGPRTLTSGRWASPTAGRTWRSRRGAPSGTTGPGTRTPSTRRTASRRTRSGSTTTGGCGTRRDSCGLLGRVLARQAQLVVELVVRSQHPGALVGRHVGPELGEQGIEARLRGRAARGSHLLGGRAFFIVLV